MYQPFLGCSLVSKTVSYPFKWTFSLTNKVRSHSMAQCSCASLWPLGVCSKSSFRSFCESLRIEKQQFFITDNAMSDQKSHANKHSRAIWENLTNNWHKYIWQSLHLHGTYVVGGGSCCRGVPKSLFQSAANLEQENQQLQFTKPLEFTHQVPYKANK